jgi:hypothetical protein
MKMNFETGGWNVIGVKALEIFRYVIKGGKI